MNRLIYFLLLTFTEKNSLVVDDVAKTPQENLDVVVENFQGKKYFSEIAD